MTRHTTTVSEHLTCRDVILAEFTVQIVFDWHAPFNGSWDEPPCGAYGEIVNVRQVSGPDMALSDLYSWAGDWMDDQMDLDDIPLSDEPTLADLKAATARHERLYGGAVA